MLEQIQPVENKTVTPLVNRIQDLEEQIKLINMRLKLQVTVLCFEFVIKVDDEQLWTGLDLPTQFAKIHSQYPDKEITISWRSSPVVWI